MGYWQSSLDNLLYGDWLPPFSPADDNATRGWIESCARAPLYQPCLNEIGVPMLGEVVLGGYPGKNFSKPTAFVLTLLVNNNLDPDANAAAMAWEQVSLSTTFVLEVTKLFHRPCWIT